MLDGVREVVGVEKAQPALFSLPAPGRLLVAADSGAWVVDEDGSKRRLGSYREASWSPFGRFVVASRRNELVALTPGGEVRWTLARPDVRFPRWGGTKTDTRIAYLSQVCTALGDASRVGGGRALERLLCRCALPEERRAARRPTRALRTCREVSSASSAATAGATAYSTASQTIRPRPGGRVSGTGSRTPGGTAPSGSSIPIPAQCSTATRHARSSRRRRPSRRTAAGEWSAGPMRINSSSPASAGPGRSAPSRTCPRSSVLARFLRSADGAARPDRGGAPGGSC